MKTLRHDELAKFIMNELTATMGLLKCEHLERNLDWSDLCDALQAATDEYFNGWIVQD